MKTLHVTNGWSDVSGGIATFYRALMDAANQRKHKMVLVVPSSSDNLRDISDHVRMYEIASPGARLNSVYRTIYPNQFLRAGGKLREILKQEQPDLVEINDKYTLNYLGPLLRLRLLSDVQFRPVVVGLTCERMDVNFQTYLSAGALGRAFCSWYMRYIYFPFFDHHIAVSDGTADELLPASKGHVVSRAVFQLPMGVDCRLFTPQRRATAERLRVLRQIGGDDGSTLLLYVGRLVPEKNLPLLLDTMEQLLSSGRDYRLLIAGDGISRASFLEDAEKRLGKRVHWLGYLGNREELANLYANSDFFLHPNPREPFGIAPLEAMASGAVLVAPDAGGVKAYATYSNALLTETTGTAFASAISRLVLDRSKRETMIASAWQTAREFSWESVTDRFFQLYEHLHAVHVGKMNFDQLEPKFVSVAPSQVRRASMRSAASIAAGIYSAYSGFNFSFGALAGRKSPERRNRIAGYQA